MGKAKKIRWTIYEVVMIVLAIAFIFPAWIVLTNSFKPLGEILSDTFGIPKSLFLDNFSYVLETMNYPRIFLNTVTICVCAIAVTVVLSAMCAYRLSRWNNKISKVILLVLMASMTVPFQSIMLPLVKICKNLNLTNSIPGLILILVPLYCPMAVFIYQGFIVSIPYEIEEAAQIDGCTRVQTFFKIIFPLLKPATSSIVVLFTLQMWNDFTLPMIMLQSAEKKTITTTVYAFFSSYSMRWDYALTSLTLSAVPMIIFFLFMQKYIISGIVAGSVKG